MRPLRPCLDCPVLHRNAKSRCSPCEARRQHRRNLSRPQYAGTWKAESRRAREQQPWCSVCGTTENLTLDHERAQVECKSCNSSHRRNAAQ